jgi:ATP-dependent exoDNAse (exonuclease V) alpha subunit
VLPATIQGIRRYLGSGLIKGIGPKMAERIVDHFGEKTLRVIEEALGRLVEVPGLGPKRTTMITAAWEEQRAIKEVMVFLQGMGCRPSLAVRIYKTYRDEAAEVVQGESRIGWPARCGDRVQDRRPDRPTPRHSPQQPPTTDTFSGSGCSWPRCNAPTAHRDARPRAAREGGCRGRRAPRRRRLARLKAARLAADG